LRKYGIQEVSLVFYDQTNVLLSLSLAPSPTKRKEDDKSKQRGKEKSGATKEGATNVLVSLKEHIQEIFSTYGKIKMIDMPMNRKALKHMDGGQIDGQEITVTAVLTPTVRPPPHRLSPPRRMSRSPRRRSPVRRRSRSPACRHHGSHSGSNSSR
uniref:RRM domain-containing protein n=1 Tax=Lates calcarifer TaxID=8187 RepID=A0A4W6ECU5_LATCA